MQRRNFVKKSVAAAIVAATPLALTGLVKADGGGVTGSDSTDWWSSTFGNSTTEEWSTEFTGSTTEDQNTEEDKTDPDSCVYFPNKTRWVYVGGKCYQLAEVNSDHDPDIQEMDPNDRPDNPECVISVIHCDSQSGNGNTNGMNCAALKSQHQDANGNDMLGPNYIKSKYCGYETGN